MAERAGRVAGGCAESTGYAVASRLVGDLGAGGDDHFVDDDAELVFDVSLDVLASEAMGMGAFEHPSCK